MKINPGAKGLTSMGKSKRTLKNVFGVGKHSKRNSYWPLKSLTTFLTSESTFGDEIAGS